MIDLSKYTRSLLGIRLSSTQLNYLEIFEKELLKWNERINLTAIRDPEQIQIKHFLDSLSCISVMRDTSMERVIDIGTGAGFPGLPLKIIYPEIELTLVESVGKKVDFCHHMVRILGLEKVQVIQARAETIGQMPGHRQKYDWATARAVAIMPVLVEYLLPLVRVGGAMLAMKGESAPAETQDAEHATRLLGGHLRKLTPVELPSVAEERYLVVIDKVAATPDKYPRRVGVPTKHPLHPSARI
jgi:16S rRNA (guanine527-N7)-methyltransferase